MKKYSPDALIGSQIDRHTDRQTHRQIDRSNGKSREREISAFALLCDASAGSTARHFDLKGRPWATGSVVAHLYSRPSAPVAPLSLSLSLSLYLYLSSIFCPYLFLSIYLSACIYPTINFTS